MRSVAQMNEALKRIELSGVTVHEEKSKSATTRRSSNISLRSEEKSIEANIFQDGKANGEKSTSSISGRDSRGKVNEEKSKRSISSRNSNDLMRAGEQSNEVRKISNEGGSDRNSRSATRNGGQLEEVAQNGDNSKANAENSRSSNAVKN